MQGPEDAKPLFDAGDWIALGAAAVALVAMSIAIWQAYEARQSRKATRDQADTAKDALDETKVQSKAAKDSATAAWNSVNAAERAAGAAEEQVVEARKAVRAAEVQVEIATRAAEAAERSAQADETAMTLAKREAHDKMTPKFNTNRQKGVVPRIEVELTMTDGPPLAKVTVRPQGQGAEAIKGLTTPGTDDPSMSLSLGAMHMGDTKVVVVHGGPSQTINLALELHCVPVEEGLDPWTVTHTIPLRQPAQIHSPAGARIPRTAEQFFNPARGQFRNRRLP